MISFLAEVTDFELWQRAVRSQFREGESIGSLIWVAAVLVGVVVLVLVLGRVQARWQKQHDPASKESSPERLYLHLLCVLGFSVAQRRLLESVAKAAGLAHPTVILVSEVLFDQSVSSWNGRGKADEGKIEQRQALAAIRAKLFPDGRGIVQSKPARAVRPN